MRIFGGDGQPYMSWEIVHKKLVRAGFRFSAGATFHLLQSQAIRVDELPRWAGFEINPRGLHGAT